LVAAAVAAIITAAVVAPEQLCGVRGNQFQFNHILSLLVVAHLGKVVMIQITLHQQELLLPFQDFQLVLAVMVQVQDHGLLVLLEDLVAAELLTLVLVEQEMAILLLGDHLLSLHQMVGVMMVALDLHQ
jgi:hypothetical protein